MIVLNRSSKIRGRQKSERGVALITTLLLLLLMTALSLAMVISVRSDLLVNGYYRNSRGSFYAADSGVNVVRQAMINGVVGAIPSTIPTTVPATAPLPATAAATANFAGWGMFIDSQPICSGTLVQGTITGPVFTNGAWNFGTGATGYTFTDPVGSVSPQFGYQIAGGCDQLATPTDTKGGSTIAPKFQGGYTLNAKKITLPTDTYDQLQAVLDG